jgi:glycosyltransferase involved in cell wall biosynthesis
MKVLHVITGLDVGGAELQLDAVLQHTRNDADVVTLYNPGPVADKLRGHGVRVRDLGMHRNTELGALLRLYKIIRAGRYDVVHAHLYRAQVYARPAARLARTPVIVTTEHSIGETHLERRKMTSSVRALYLASELASDATIAVADIVRDRLERWGVPAQKITVIPNGLDFDGLGFDPGTRASVREQFGIHPDAYVMGTLGRLDPNKRVDLAIEAAAPLLSDRCKLLVIGRGADGDRLQAAADRAGVADHVIFGGYQADMTAMLSGPVHHVPGAGRDQHRPGPPGRRDRARAARRDDQGSRGRLPAAPAGDQRLRRVRHRVGGRADRRPVRAHRGRPPGGPRAAQPAHVPRGARLT